MKYTWFTMLVRKRPSSLKMSSGCLVRLAFTLFLFKTIFSLSAVSGQNCLCSGIACEKNLTGLECSSGRVIPRGDCSCCLACAKQLTDDCNQQDLPCDADFGLTCGLQKKCEAQTECSDDAECGNDRFCFSGACADPCKVLPDVCQDNGPTNGICTVRNHRALCSCPMGHALLEGKQECIPTVVSVGVVNEEEGKTGTHCDQNGTTLNPGEKMYGEKCSKECECGTNGEMTCRESSRTPDCKEGLIPMSSVTGEMTQACKILIGNTESFDGCCVPEACRSVTSQDHPGINNKGRDYKLPDSQNNLRDEEEEAHQQKDDGDKLSPSREMLLKSSEEDHKVLDEILQKIPPTKDAKHGAPDGLDQAAQSMEVTVFKTTPHSASIKLPLHEKGAVLSISLSRELKESIGNGRKGSSQDNETLWKEHMIPPGLPMLTLSDLTPNTSYTIKYSVGSREYPVIQFLTPDNHEDAKGIKDGQMEQTPVAAEPDDREIGGSGEEEDTSTQSSEQDEKQNNSQETGITNSNETEIQTLSPVSVAAVPGSTQQPPNGCLFNETLYEVGAIVLEGCDQRCECLKAGQMKCMERCSIPFFKKGTFSADPLCFEEPSGNDDCCVIVACARSSHAGTARELVLNPCDSVKCGPNANCRHEVSPAGMQAENPNPDTLCVCNENFLGDPYDGIKGCEPVMTPSTLTSSSIKPTPASTPEKKVEGCVSNNKTFGYGEEYLDGCSYKCHCEESGEFLCLPRCNYRHDEEGKIPAGCGTEKDPSDPECCEILICAGDATGIKKEKTKVSPDGCLYKNRTYEKEEKFFDGCEQQCLCFSNGDVTCQPRCPPIGPSVHLDKDCITLQDPSDACCTVTVCGNQTVSDVMKEAMESERKRLADASNERARILHEMGEHSDNMDVIEARQKNLPKISLKVSMVMPINDSSILVSIRIPEDELATLEEETILILYSTNKTAPVGKWSEMSSKVKELFVEGSEELHTVIGGLEPGREYFFQVKVNGTESNIGSAFTKSRHERPLMTGSMEESNEGRSSAEESKNDSGPTSMEAACHYKNKMFAAGEEFYDGCDEYCVCEDSGAVQCEPIECPTEFGLDLLDSHCVKWEPIMKDGERTPPNCCPEMRCVQNSSCAYQGLTFRNFEEIPQKLSGCDMRCYCEYGNVTCQSACPPISSKPPTSLPCPPELATTMPLPHDECCMMWVCPGAENQTTNGTLPLLLPNATAPSAINRNRTAGTEDVTSFPSPPDRPPQRHPIHHGIIYDEEDQFVPPSTGNIPTVIPLENLPTQQLQDLLHQLSTQIEAGGGPHAAHPFGQGIFVSVKRPEEIRDLERNGATVVGHEADGSTVLRLPDEAHARPPFFPPFPPRPIPHNPSIKLPGSDQFPPFGPHFQDLPHSGVSHDEINGVTIRALNESTLHIDFTVSPVLVGLQGAVEVSYTNEFATKPDPAQWEKQLFQQPEDIIDNSHLQLFLSGLKPDSDYHLQIQVIISNIHNSPISDIFVIRTPPQALPPEIKIDPEIKVIETTSRTAEVSWRKFTGFESSLIDGVQIKYKAYDDQLYATTELIHRSISSYKLTNLQPGKKYEVDLLLVPFTNQTTELNSEGAIHIETPPEVDDFSFTIALQTGKIAEQNAELIWEGVPFPEDKFVNIYQVLYQSDNQKEQKNYFKVADRETTKKAVLTDLKPGTRYRVWLEAFLTNGKKKRSNVIYVLTKVGSLPSPEKSEQESNLLSSQSPGVVEQTTSYYGALVALAIVATVSVFGIIALLMILIKKQNQAKIPINDRKSESSYDNPSFKNYDVEANGHTNKASEL